MSEQPPPAPTASTAGPCPTLIQISRTSRHWKFTQHHRTTQPPPSFLELWLLHLTNEANANRLWLFVLVDLYGLQFKSFIYQLQSREANRRILKFFPLWRFTRKARNFAHTLRLFKFLIRSHPLIFSDNNNVDSAANHAPASGDRLSTDDL